MSLLFLNINLNVSILDLNVSVGKKTNQLTHSLFGSNNWQMMIFALGMSTESGAPNSKNYSA